MRPLSISQRLALLNGLLLGAFFCLAFLLLIWLSTRFMVRHVSESVDAEIHVLVAEFEIDGLRGVIGLVNHRLALNTRDHARHYRLENSEGLLLAGNQEYWPSGDAAENTQFRVWNPASSTHIVYEWTALPDGSRLLIGFDEIEVRQVRDGLREASLWTFLAVLLLSVPAGFAVTRLVLRPVATIRRSALKIMQGDLQHRIGLRGTGDDFDRLASDLNRMLDRIEALITTVKGATDNIAHDLRSPLTRHRSRIEALLETLPHDSPLHAELGASLLDLDQILATFRSLLRIASIESGLLKREFRDCDLGDLAQDVVEYLEPLAEDRNLGIALRRQGDLRMRCHRDLLFQVLLNLLDNAIKYSPDHTTIELKIQSTERGVQIDVVDQGPGIPLPLRQRVFERLFRGDQARRTPGLGLGLSLVKAIVDLHGGSIDIPEQESGTHFRLVLPSRPV